MVGEEIIWGFTIHAHVLTCVDEYIFTIFYNDDAQTTQHLVYHSPMDQFARDKNWSKLNEAYRTKQQHFFLI